MGYAQFYLLVVFHIYLHMVKLFAHNECKTTIPIHCNFKWLS